MSSLRHYPLVSIVYYHYNRKQFIFNAQIAFICCCVQETGSWSSVGSSDCGRSNVKRLPLGDQQATVTCLGGRSR